jgi:hypothetical protein
MLTKEDLIAIEGIMDKKIKPVRLQLNRLQKDIDTVVRVFDSDIVDLKDRADKLEAAVFI